MTITQVKAEVYLNRAAGLIKETIDATQDLRQRAIQHDSTVNSDQPFLKGMVSALKGSRNLTQRKSSLLRDIELAKQEIANSERSDPEATIEAFGGTVNSTSLRAIATYATGQLELVWGKAERAKELFYESLHIAEFADAHYMLGLLYEGEFKPKDALSHFEQCLELEPDGEFSVSALREANAMRNYRKKFRGSWLALLFLFIFPIPVLGAVLYFLLKFR